jgi:transcriptional regulator with XRE-family HTH domain
MVCTASTRSSDAVCGAFARIGRHFAVLGSMSENKQSSAPTSAPIGSNLQRLRVQRGLSIPELAQSSGVSERLLADVEAGSLSPTIKLLWSIATALRVPFSTLIASAGRTDISRSQAQGERRKPARVVRRALLPTSRSERHTEVYELKLAAHACEDAPLYPEDALETLLVTKGSVVVESQLEQQLLQTGDSIELRGDSERAYLNPTDSEAVLYVMVAPRR